MFNTFMGNAMDRFLRGSLVIGMMALIIGCSATEPTATAPGASKADGEITWMGTGSGTAPLYVSWVDCDGVLVTGALDLHFVFGWDYGTPPSNGLTLNTSWNARGICTGEDGSEYNYIDNGGFREYVESTDECVIGHNGWQRILITKKGSGKVYSIKYHYWFTLNTCTGESSLKFDDWKVECD